MMISKKPKLTEQQFLRGSNGSTASEAGTLRPRLPEDLAQRLKDLAYDRRMSVNALIVDLLEKAVKTKKG